LSTWPARLPGFCPSGPAAVGSCLGDYATVTLSTTGYGDIVPVTDAARLVNTVLITPIRVIFLILLAVPRWRY
jgi:voltage-gated potassium channel Kch